MPLSLFLAVLQNDDLQISDLIQQISANVLASIVKNELQVFTKSSVPRDFCSPSRPQPPTDCVPFNIEIHAYFFKSCHRGKQANQLQQLNDGLILRFSGLVSSRHILEHVFMVCLLYDLFGFWPCPRAHEAVLGCAAGSKVALEGKERIPEKEPSEVRSAAYKICNLILVRNAGYLWQRQRCGLLNKGINV